MELIKLQNLERMVKEIDERVGRLEREVFERRERSLPIEIPRIELKDLNVPDDILSRLQSEIRKVGSGVS